MPATHTLTFTNTEGGTVKHKDVVSVSAKGKIHWKEEGDELSFQPLVLLRVTYDSGEATQIKCISFSLE